MARALQIIDREKPGEITEMEAFVTLRIDGQLFAIQVTLVRDVLRGLRVTPVPLAPSEVVGSLNLRGRIVTALDMRICLGLPASGQAPGAHTMSVVAEYKGECYSLIVDSVGEVVSLPASQIEENPANLPVRWRELAGGIYKLPDELLVILDVRKLFNF